MIEMRLLCCHFPMKLFLSLYSLVVSTFCFKVYDNYLFYYWYNCQVDTIEKSLIVSWWMSEQKSQMIRGVIKGLGFACCRSFLHSSFYKFLQTTEKLLATTNNPSVHTSISTGSSRNNFMIDACVSIATLVSDYNIFFIKLLKQLNFRYIVF